MNNTFNFRSNLTFDPSSTIPNVKGDLTIGEIVNDITDSNQGNTGSIPLTGTVTFREDPTVVGQGVENSTTIITEAFEEIELQLGKQSAVANIDSLDKYAEKSYNAVGVNSEFFRIGNTRQEILDTYPSLKGDVVNTGNAASFSNDLKVDAENSSGEINTLESDSLFISVGDTPGVEEFSELQSKKFDDFGIFDIFMSIRTPQEGFDLSEQPDDLAFLEQQVLPQSQVSIGLGTSDVENAYFYLDGMISEATPVSTPSFFDTGFYLEEYQDIAAAIEDGRLDNAFKHFEEFGIEEGRTPNPNFDETGYLNAHSDVAAAVDSGSYESGLKHYVLFGADEGRDPGGVSGTGNSKSNKENDPSSLFSSSFYLSNNQDVAAAVEDGSLSSALEHFEKFGEAEGRDPSPLFDSSFYRANNQDVVDAVEDGSLSSALEHFEKYGIGEGRSPNPDFDENGYLKAHSDVAAAVDSGSYESGLEHYVLFGADEGRNPGGVDESSNAASPEVALAGLTMDQDADEAMVI